MDEAYFKKSETEADGLRAGALRLFKARHQSLALTDQIPASLQLPSNMQTTTEPESSPEEIVVVTPELQEASTRMADLLKRRREG